MCVCVCVSIEFNADVETYVVQTNYNEYVIWVILSTEQPSGIKTTLVKLYSMSFIFTYQPINPSPSISFWYHESHAILME